MSSYGEWLGRQIQNQQKYLDTRPHRDAGHHTEVVKREATLRIDRRPTGLRVLPASGYTDYVGGVGVRSGEQANTKTPQLTVDCRTVAEPSRKVRPTECCKSCGKNTHPVESCCTRNLSSN